MDTAKIILFLFCIAAVSQLVKLTDVLLLDEQKIRFGEWVSTKYEALKKVNPIGLLALMRRESMQWLLLVPALVGVGYVAFVFGKNIVEEVGKRWSWSLTGIWDSILGMVVSIWAALYSMSLVYKFWRSRMKRLEEPGKFNRTVITDVLVFALVAGAFSGLLWFAIQIPTDTTMFLVLIVSTIPLSFAMIACFPPATSELLLLIAFLLTRLAYAGLIGARWIVKRIVMYQHGAVQAVSALITGLLGVVAAYLAMVRALPG